MPDTYPQPLTPAELGQLFPLYRDRLGPDVFELGLVLGGTVFAGAYTAGVLDFLMESLDAWTAAKERGDQDAVTQRLQAVYDLAMQAARPDKWYARVLLSAAAGAVWRLYARGALRDEALTVIRRGLQDQFLLPPATPPPAAQPPTP